MITCTIDFMNVQIFFIHSFLILFHKRLPRKIRGLPRGKHRGVTFGESQGVLTGVT